MKLFIFLITFLSFGQTQTFPYNSTLSKQLSAFCLASNCPEAVLRQWICGQVCDLNPGGLQNLKILLNETTEAYGYIGYSKQQDALITVFKGTNPYSTTNWITDINFSQVSYPLCNNNCKVHGGFYEHFKSIRQQLLAEFQQLKQLYPNSKVYVTGHSLGATTAAHSIPEIYRLNGNKQIDIFYNYGSPRVGNKDYADWFIQSAFVKEFARVTNGQDPVPHLPPFQFKFYHIPQEVFYYQGAQTNYTQCYDSEITGQCSNMYFLSANPFDHLEYLGLNWQSLVFNCTSSQQQK